MPGPAVAVRPVGGEPGSAAVDVDGVPMSARVAEVAEPRFTVIALDRPGYGSSAPHAGQMASPARRAGLAYGAVDRLLATRPRGAGIFLAGHSMGCVLAVRMAFGGLGLRQPVLQAWMSVVTEVGAGALLVAGLLTPLACAAVISVMLVAGLLAHRPNGFFVFREGYEYVLVLSVACLALAVLGPGRWSADAAAGIMVTGWAGGGVALGVAVVATAGLLATFWRPSPAQAEPSEAEAARS